MSTKSYCLTKWLSNLGPVHTYPDIFLIRNVFFRIQKFPHPHVREFVANLLSATRESGFKNNWIHWMRIDGSCIQKENVADSKLREDEYV